MNKRTVLTSLKIIISILLLLSLLLLYHYETGIKGNYQSNTEAYEKDSQKIVSLLDSTGCSSVMEVSEKTEFGYLEARYLMQELSKDRLIVKYQTKGICLTLSGKLQATQTKK